MTHEHQGRYAALAVAILAAGVLAEGTRLVDPWPGFSPAASRVVSVFLMGLWAATAAVVIRRSRREREATRAWAFATSAPLAMFIHATVTRVGGSWIGLAYAAAAVGLAFVLKRTFVGRSRLISSSRFTSAIRR